MCVLIKCIGLGAVISKLWLAGQLTDIHQELNLMVFENMYNIFSHSVKNLKKKLNILHVGLGGLGVTCSSRDPRFADSNPTEVNGFF